MTSSRACEPFSELIGLYLDNALPAEARRRVEVHLLSCPACAWEVQSLTITCEYLRAESGEVLPSDAFRARVLSRLRVDNPHLTAEPVAETPLQYQLPIA